MAGTKESSERKKEMKRSEKRAAGSMSAFS